ncbi:hypothetical protein DS745_16015 [Anaerobacillus alkaliphilus]|uniref:Uncharacterized protein n=1 Tax=Anaerobacillus alkaliphilus TaxID=1548597 RepID=A0A4Q0VPM4_9BACI|nr:hypothetical protein [Anaerobacillus alkaliphilus]RXI97865.1 hypothetical protein DS745_16015 [Anaerobacillus alkaliphilus]
MNYEQMSTSEIVAYYKRVRNYIDQGFRVEGLKDELHLISKTLKQKSREMNKNELAQYLGEIDSYLKNIRH